MSESSPRSPVTCAPGLAEIEAKAGSGIPGPGGRLVLKVRRRLGLVHPFEVEVPTPPRRDPTRLTGELWAVTAFFNPGGGVLQKENYDRFRAGLARPGVPLLTVELAFADGPFQLGPADADRLVQLRGGDVLWQKDRLLNIGVESLPDACDRVAWLDADILFDRPGWAEETARLLETYAVVQPFLRRVRLEKGRLGADVGRLPVGMSEGQVHFGIAYGVAAKGPGVLSSYRKHGSTGLAWAARRSLLRRHGLYDRLVLGGSDKAMARAMFVGSAGLAAGEHPPALERDLAAWCDAFHDDVRGSVGYADCTVFHLWHGSSEGRRYGGRAKGLVDNAYDPRADVTVGPRGALVWARDKPALRRWVEEYFAGREVADGALNPPRPSLPPERLPSG